MKNIKRFRNLMISKLNKILKTDEYYKGDLLKRTCLDYEIQECFSSWVGEQFLYDILNESGINIRGIISFENVIADCPTILGATCGFRRTSNGNIVFGFMFGGDWQVPANAVLYFEDSKFKIFVPRKANSLKRNCLLEDGEQGEDYEYNDYSFLQEIENELRI